jgi:hypothetical protein
MRTLTLTLTLNPEDGAFDLLTADDLLDSVKLALLRGYPLLRESEMAVEWVADAYEPTVPR